MRVVTFNVMGDCWVRPEKYVPCTEESLNAENRYQKHWFYYTQDQSLLKGPTQNMKTLLEKLAGA